MAIGFGWKLVSAHSLIRIRCGGLVWLQKHEFPEKADVDSFRRTTPFEIWRDVLDDLKPWPHIGKNACRRNSAEFQYRDGASGENIQSDSIAYNGYRRINICPGGDALLHDIGANEPIAFRVVLANPVCLVMGTAGYFPSYRKERAIDRQKRIRAPSEVSGIWGNPCRGIRKIRTSQVDQTDQMVPFWPRRYVEKEIPPNIATEHGPGHWRIARFRYFIWSIGRHRAVGRIWDIIAGSLGGVGNSGWGRCPHMRPNRCVSDATGSATPDHLYCQVNRAHARIVYRKDEGNSERGTFDAAAHSGSSHFDSDDSPCPPVAQWDQTELDMEYLAALTGTPNS